MPDLIRHPATARNSHAGLPLTRTRTHRITIL